jgi:AsmA-like protein
MKRSRKIVLISLSSLAGLLVIGAVVVWLLLPTIVRSVVAGAVRENTQLTMELGDIEVHGLTSITLIDLRLTDPADGDREVIYIERLEVDLDGLPLGDDLHVADLRVTNLRAMAVLDTDGKLNFSRLITPKPSDGETLIEHLAVTGADLRLLDLTAEEAPEASAEDGHHVPPHKLAQMQDVGVELSRIDATSKNYDLTLTIGDQAWGPVTIGGQMNTETGQTRLAMTRGDLRITPDNLATLPGVPEALIAQMKPEARIFLKEYVSGPRGDGRSADIEVTGIGVTPPRLQRLSGMTLAVNLADDLLIMKLRNVPQVTGEAIGTVGDIQANLSLNLDSGKFDLDIPNASIMEGRIAGNVTVPDIRAEQLLPEGKLTMTGVRGHDKENNKILTLDGSLAFHRAKAETEGGATRLAAVLAGRVGVLEAAEEGDPPGSEVELLNLPVRADWSLNLDNTADPIAFEVTVGNAKSPLELKALGAFDHKNRELLLSELRGVLRLTEELFDVATAFDSRAEMAKQLQVSGNIAFFAAEKTRVPLDALQNATGLVTVESDNFTFQLGNEPEPETATFTMAVSSLDKTVARFAAKLNAGLASGGRITGNMKLDADGKPIERQLDVTGLHLSDIRLKTLAMLGFVPDEYRAAIKELPEFTMSADAALKGRPDADTGDEILTASATVSFPGHAARVVAKGTYLAADKHLAGDVTALDIHLTRELVDSLRPALAEINKAAVERLDKELARAPAFAMTVGAQSAFKADVEAGTFTADKPRVHVNDLSATIVETLDGQPVTVALTGGAGNVALTDTMELDSVQLTANIFGGRPTLLLRQGAKEKMDIEVTLPDNAPLRFEQLPEPIRRKAPQLRRGAVAGKVTLEATSDQRLADGQLAGDGTFKVRGAHLVIEQDDGTPITVVADCDALVKLEPPADRESKLPSAMTVDLSGIRLADAHGASYLPRGGDLTLWARIDGHRSVPDSRITLRLPGNDGVACRASYNRTAGDVAVTVEKLSLEMASLWRESMAAPIRSHFEKLAPQGRVTGSGKVKLNVKADSLLDSAVYDLKLTGRQVSAVNPKTGVRSPARDVDATLRRANAADSHWATVVTRHPTDGSLDAAAGYSPERLSVRATLDKFVLAPEWVALAGGDAKACNLAGLFDGNPKATLSRDTLGRWIPAEMSGTLTGRNLSGNDPSGDLKFSGGLLKVTLAPEKIVLETFEGNLADGKIKASIAGLLPPVRDDPKRDWRITGGKLNIERIDLRQFESVAKRPPNELQGRLWIDMASGEDYGFEGPLGDRDKWKAKGKTRFGEGHLWRMPLMKALQNEIFQGIAKVLRGKFDPTSFRKAEADFTLADGKVNLPGTTIDSDMIRLLITGDIYLANRLDLKIATSVRLALDDRAEGIGELIPGFKKELDRFKDILDRLPGGEIPILFGYYTATGTFDDPLLKKDPDGSLRGFGKALGGFLKREDDAPAEGDKPDDKKDDKKPARPPPLFRIPLLR